MPSKYYVEKHIFCSWFMFCFIVMKFEDKQSITMGYVYFHDCFHFSMRRSSCEILSMLSITTRLQNFWRKNFTFSQISILIWMIILTKVVYLDDSICLFEYGICQKSYHKLSVQYFRQKNFNHSTKRNTRTMMTFCCTSFVNRLQ